MILRVGCVGHLNKKSPLVARMRKERRARKTARTTSSTWSRQGNTKLYKLSIHEKSCEARLICYLIISWGHWRLRTKSKIWKANKSISWAASSDWRNFNKSSKLVFSNLLSQGSIQLEYDYSWLSELCFSKNKVWVMLRGAIIIFFRKILGFWPNQRTPHPPPRKLGRQKKKKKINVYFAF